MLARYLSSLVDPCTCFIRAFNLLYQVRVWRQYAAAHCDDGMERIDLWEPF